MHTKQANELYRKIHVALLDKSFLKRLEIEKKEMAYLLEKKKWIPELEVLLEKKTITCQDVVALAEPTLLYLVEKEPEEGWLFYIYRFLIRSVYPHREDIVLSVSIPKAVFVYLEILRIFIAEEKSHRLFDCLADFAFATEEEMLGSPYEKTYNTFLKQVENEYIYELMWIGREIMPFNLLAHVAGVHHIAMHVARQLVNADMPIDLGLISGAAAGHDFGKFGCKDSETKRIPYLHYYYTDLWFRSHKLQEIGHVAANHSTWDLELDNLPIESLILIYADFRVKSDCYIDGKEHMKLYSLEDSFDVILSKLDNVDVAKENRYRLVYSRLVDFEKYMNHLGVNTDLRKNMLTEVVHKDLALLDMNETVEAFKNISIKNNIHLMHKLSRETSFNDILENARSTRDWKNTRTYLNIFTEFYSYMTQKQKRRCMRFLYELMVHREGDIRRQAGYLIGKIIANYDIEYSKELPADTNIILDETTSLEVWKNYVSLILVPDHKMVDRHRRWLGYGLKRVVTSLMQNMKPTADAKKYISEILQYYKKFDWAEDTIFILIDAITVIPKDLITKEEMMVLLDFMNHFVDGASLEIRATILLNIKDMKEDILQLENHSEIVWNIVERMVIKANVSLEFLLFKIGEIYGLKDRLRGVSYQRIFEDEKVISDMFLVNLKAATPWKIKMVNIELLYERVCLDRNVPKLHASTHLCNLLKVSEQVRVRHFAGETLIKLASFLTWDERNDVAVELMKGLEIGEIQFAKYIPMYLGEYLMYLHPKELDEMIRDLRNLQNGFNDRIPSLVLDTFGVMLCHYPKYRTRFPEYVAVYEGRRNTMLGTFLSGFASYHESVNREAFWVVGRELFGSDLLNLKLKKIMFTFLSKKMATIATQSDTSSLAFFNDTIGWKGIYKFITDYLFEHKTMAFRESKKIAFFPGTYDPFTLGHKEIATAIRNMGFEVYLALDGFSWSKKTQPHKIRRKILEMSIANEENIYLFPSSIPINIANPEDLGKLRELFPDKEVYMVAGSDVVENASSYRVPICENSIQTFKHVLFLRESEVEKGDFHKESYEQIQNEVVELKLPTHFEDISSTRIRENIDNNRDITNLIDTMAQNYIYQHGLYLREPQYKSLLKTRNIEVVHYFDKQSVEQALIVDGQLTTDVTLEMLSELNEDIQMIGVWDETHGRQLDGLMIFQGISTRDLYNEFQEAQTASYVRKYTSGKIVLLRTSYVRPNATLSYMEQTLLTETLAEALKQDYTYAVAHKDDSELSRKMREALERQGFLSQRGVGSKKLYTVDMKNPLTLYHNMQTAIKEPFNENERVLRTLKKAHYRLQKALTKLYPGELVISFDAGIMQNRLIELITKANDVSKIPTVPRVLGQKMCVPYGKIMKGIVIPNTVTKVLHTEKVFDPELTSFSVKEFSQHLSLEEQIRTINSFKRPAILVDDLLHKGYRIKELDVIFKEEGIEIDRAIIGVLSGRGKDVMEIQGRDVESAYFVPSLKAWFVETSLYPFIGGDAVKQPEGEKQTMIPSINLILPYMMPGFLPNAHTEDIYHLSRVCLKNTKLILEVLQEEYQKEFERSLTLDRLNEVVISPRLPDFGQCLQYDYNLAPSVYIDSDLERLARFQNFLNTTVNTMKDKDEFKKF
ncbi:MAG: hypothetical protein R3Y53_05260 [Bacillota bacterium]